MEITELFKRSNKKYTRPNELTAYNLSNWSSNKSDCYSNGDTINVYYSLGGNKEKEKFLISGFLHLSSDPYSQSCVYNQYIEIYAGMAFWIGDFGFSFYEGRCILLEKNVFFY